MSNWHEKYEQFEREHPLEVPNLRQRILAKIDEVKAEAREDLGGLIIEDDILRIFRALRVAVLGLEPVVTMGETYDNDLLIAIGKELGSVDKS